MQQRAPHSKSSPPEDAAASHEEAPTSESAVDLASEVQALSAKVRSHLRFLEDGGVTALPKPLRRAARPAAPIRNDVAEHAMPPARLEGPPRLPSSPPPSPLPSMAPPPNRAPAPPPPPRPSARSAIIAEAVYPELPPPHMLRGAEGLSTVRRVLGDCRRCKLCHGRNNLVFDDGAGDAWLAFVGEGPGADEDRLGKPFVGAAGQLLDKMIDAMAAEARKRGLEEVAQHLGRQAVYICNVVKCRPPGNRTPEPDEIAACAPFLRSQIYSLRPTLRAIVALGRTPTQYLLKTAAPISSLRGQIHDWEGVPVMPTYHPAYLLRTPSAKRQVWEDLQKVLDTLSQPPTLSIMPPGK